MRAWRFLGSACLAMVVSSCTLSYRPLRSDVVLMPDRPDGDVDVPADVPQDQDAPDGIVPDVPDVFDAPDVLDDTARDGADAPDVDVIVPVDAVDASDIVDATPDTVLDAPMDASDVADVSADSPPDVPPCPGTQVLCAGICTDLATSSLHCGRCGNPCTGLRRCNASMCVDPASCNEIHRSSPALPSGAYPIDPDRAGPRPSVTAYCDMSTDMGGWTYVFLPSSYAFASQTIDYSLDEPALLAAATQTLIAMRFADGRPQAGWARFPIPVAWRTASPFRAATTDIPVTGLLVDGESTTTGTLRFGFGSFPANCSAGWLGSAPGFGRVCIDGTRAPFFSGFAASGTDYCARSHETYNAALCGADNRFTIAVR